MSTTALLADLRANNECKSDAEALVFMVIYCLLLFLDKGLLDFTALISYQAVACMPAQ